MISRCSQSSIKFSASDGNTMVFDWGPEKLIIEHATLIGWDAQITDYTLTGEPNFMPRSKGCELNLKLVGVPRLDVNIDFPVDIHRLSILEIMGFVNERIKGK